MCWSNRARVLLLLTLSAPLCVPAAASAQTTTGPSITASSQVYPDRIDINGNDLGQSIRPINLNPLGINYDDCIKNLRLRFNVTLSGFTGSDTLQVWATNAGDCTANVARGIGASAATCWMVSPGKAGLVQVAPNTLTFDIWVRDIVGPQGTPPWPAGLAQTEVRGEGAGAKACTAQPSFAAVPMYIWFMAVNAQGGIDGTPYEYGGGNAPFTTDLVGPPAPAGISISDGDTFFVVNWSANLDSDTAGYDVFIDPIPGQEGLSARPSASTTLYCPDAAANSLPPPVGEGGDDGSLADSSDASTTDATAFADSSDASTTDAMASGAAMADSACFPINVGGPTTGASGCNDPVLSSSIVQDSGTTAVPLAVPLFDEAGNTIDSGVVTGTGGLSTVPCQYLVGGCAANGLTVSGQSSQTYAVKGLKNGTTYTVVVSAVDGSGNIGPPSSQACDYPAPVSDFWSTYRAAGGRAGGGFCSLEAVGLPGMSSVTTITFSAAAFAFWRRRKKR